jgi:hypothetical protein
MVFATVPDQHETNYVSTENMGSLLDENSGGFYRESKHSNKSLHSSSEPPQSYPNDTEQISRTNSISTISTTA